MTQVIFIISVIFQIHNAHGKNNWVSAQESMIRTLKEFKIERLIDIREGNIVILDSDTLRNLPY